MRIVVDTNTLADALFGAQIRGREDHARHARVLLARIQSGEFEWITSESIVREYMFVTGFLIAPALMRLLPPRVQLSRFQELPRKLKAPLEKVYRLVMAHSETVVINEPLPPHVPMPPDPHDVVFIEAAYFGNADAIVTRDHHLNGLPSFETSSGHSCALLSAWQLVGGQR